MQLRAETAAPVADVEASVGAVLDRRLLKGSARPIAVGLSGGGDSLALALVVAAWAQAAGRRLLVLTVDHGLRSESVAWTQACQATAARLSADFQALCWVGSKPATGLPAAARAARHALMADAARAAGARVILLGHTATDVAESARMRATGSTTPDPREWAPSPAWPEGRGLFLLRPMLGLARSDIRAWLAARGETWIDDPSNEDLGFARPRARQALGEERPWPTTNQPASAKALALACEADAEGGFAIGRPELRAAVPEARVRFLAAACLCAAGTTRPPARAQILGLAERLLADGPVVATLAGARIEAKAATVRFQREAGEAARGGLAPLALKAGETGIWDGRFEITAPKDVVVSAAVRSVGPNVDRATSLTYERLLAACGAVDREPS